MSDDYCDKCENIVGHSGKDWGIESHDEYCPYRLRADLDDARSRISALEKRKK